MGVTPPRADASAPGSERRRSTRVLLVVPVEVTWTQSSGVRVQEHAETEVVNAHGALLRTKTHLPRGTLVELTRLRTHEKARGRVVFASGSSPEGFYHIGVELTDPCEKFWGVTLPPVANPPAAS